MLCLTIDPPFDIWAGHPDSDIVCVSVYVHCEYACESCSTVMWLCLCYNVRMFLLSLLFSEYLISPVSVQLKSVFEYRELHSTST